MSERALRAGGDGTPGEVQRLFRTRALLRQIGGVQHELGVLLRDPAQDFAVIRRNFLRFETDRECFLIFAELVQSVGFFDQLRDFSPPCRQREK